MTMSSLSAASRVQMWTTRKRSPESPRRLSATVLTSAVRLHQRFSLRPQVMTPSSESLPLAHIGPERYIAKQSTEDQLFSPAEVQEIICRQLF
jgi:hypothetical protein